MPTTPKREVFGLYVDVDLPSHPDNYKQFQRRNDKGSLYLTDDRGDIQLWLTGSPATLRLLANELVTAAEQTEQRLTATDKDSV